MSHGYSGSFRASIYGLNCSNFFGSICAILQMCTYDRIIYKNMCNQFAEKLRPLIRKVAPMRKPNQIGGTPDSIFVNDSQKISVPNFAKNSTAMVFHTAYHKSSFFTGTQRQSVSKVHQNVHFLCQ